MKRMMLTTLTLALALSLAACGQKEAAPTAPSTGAAGGEKKEVTLKVGATAVPHAEILNAMKAKLREQGVNLEVKEFNDYIQPNVQVFEKQLDANFYQHKPYLEKFNKDKNMNLVSVASVHIEPFGGYSRTIKKIDELKNGAKVAIPSDPSNGGRALALLANNNLIKLADGVGVNGTLKDIIDNPKKLTITELEAAMLPRVLDEVDLALINTNYAFEAKLVPTKDALFIEGSDSPYVNTLVARPDNKDSDAMQKLAKALNSEDVKKFIQEKYQGAVVPAF